MMTLTHMRCPTVMGKTSRPSAPTPYNVANLGPCILCPLCTVFFRNTPYPHCQLKTPIALVVQVLAALTEGVGINAATRLYGVSKNSIYRWQED